MILLILLVRLGIIVTDQKEAISRLTSRNWLNQPSFFPEWCYFQNDFEDSIDWYIENANEIIAGDFIEVVTAALDTIRDNNYIARMANEIPDLREYIIQQFPFIISYWIKDQTEIVITSFLPQKKKK